MADPLTPERLAELRRIATGEDWSPPEREDLTALIGEIDRLRANEEYDIAQGERRRVTWAKLEAENAKLATDRDRLWMLLEIERGLTGSARLHAAALKRVTAFQLEANGESAERVHVDELANQLLRVLGPQRPQGAPRPDAERRVVASAMDFPSEAAPEPQRPAEGFERDSDGLPAVCPKCHGSGNKSPIADCDACGGSGFARPVDLSGELDDFGPEHTAELKRISGLDVPTGAPLSAPCGHAPYWLVLGEDGVGCMVCGPAKAEEIAPEDEGISSADVTAQAASDARHERFEIDSEGLAVPCRTCEGRGSTSYGADCPDCGHPETNCACG